MHSRKNNKSLIRTVLEQRNKDQSDGSQILHVCYLQLLSMVASWRKVIFFAKDPNQRKNKIQKVIVSDFSTENKYISPQFNLI